MSRRLLSSLAVLALLVPLAGAVEPTKPAAAPVVAPKWGPWLEPGAPFFSSVLDARRAGPGEHNLTPRGLVLRLGNDLWACFDVDLLRVAAVWRGAGVSQKALAPGSYHDPSRKTLGGQFPAPQPEGKLWLANGIYPGWQRGEVKFTDPRTPAPTAGEVGRGPLPEGAGRFEAIRLTPAGAVLEYTLGGTKIAQWMRSAQHGQLVAESHYRVEPSTETLRLVVGAKAGGPAEEVATGVTLSGGDGVSLQAHDDYWVVQVAPHARAMSFAVAMCDEASAPKVAVQPIPSGALPRQWEGEAQSTITPSKAEGALVVDHIGLPTENPWQRALRVADVQFWQDGTAAVITVDGDVWIARGLAQTQGTVRWTRFASGLHEPLSLCLREEQLYAYDRNGIWRLRDTDGNGEADVHELFSNAFAQTADMREFPSQLRLGPKGEFVISKGGQEATTLGKHNGSVLRISADGRSSTVLGYGFRQPNIGVNIRTGLVTASDQEGQYIPSTPLHIVRDRQFYGFLSELLPKEKYPAPIADPVTWIPHANNASAMGQVWMFGAKWGPLTDSLVHIGFNRPEIFRVLWNERGAKPQAAVVSLTSAFDFPPLNGGVNPADGQLYLAGFQVIGWGNVLSTLAGLGRVRYTGAPVLVPNAVVPMKEGVLLSFDTELAESTAKNPDSFSLATWSYKRKHTYGSAQYKENGETGMDALTASSAYLSQDKRKVFVGVPGMKPVQQLRVGWALQSVTGVKMEENAYTTPYELPAFDPKAVGFGDITVDLTPRATASKLSGPVTVEEGRKVAQMFGCVACHAADAVDFPKVGPKWQGLFGAQRQYVTPEKKTGTCVADEAYLRESIVDPHAKTVAGFDKSEYAMPSFAGVLTEAQVESLVLYIKTLK